MSLPEKNKKCELSPTKQRTPRQLHCQKNVGIYFAQSKNTIAISSKTTESSEDDEDQIDSDQLESSKDGSIKKRKNNFSDPMDKKCLKIRKTFDSNITVIDEEDDCHNYEISKTPTAEHCKKVSKSSVSSLKEPVNKTDLISDNEKTQNEISCNQLNLEGLEELFEEEWSIEDNSELSGLFEDDWTLENEIDFSSPKRCIIIDIIWEKSFMTLTLKDFYNDISATVQCSGIWRYTKIEPGEPIIVKAKKEPPTNNYWSVNNDFGFVISQPDTLISGTSVVGALWCHRRSALQEKFKMIESLPYNTVGNHYMLTGSLTHELLQKALDMNLTEIKQISALLDDLLKSKRAIHMMYTSNISLSDCNNLMRPAVPQIYKFIQRYIKGVKPEVADQNFDGKIVKICDIEENVWLPNLGLKGKIDLTVEVSSKIKNKNFNGVEHRILPLEVKTGRSLFSSEHQGQLILYTMMMNMTNRETNSGLLLYLRENIMKEVTGSNYAQRDLLTLRNTVAYYLTRQPTIINVDGKEMILPMEFPKPISHSQCSKCPYNVLCSVYLTEEDKKDFTNSHPLKSISENVTSHLSPEHIAYVMKYVSLLQLEDNTDSQESVTWKDIWILPPSQREKRGTCISSLNIVSVVEKNERFLHEFHRVRNSEAISEICLSDFSNQEYVIISTNNRINICSGFIDSVTSSSVFVYCEKDNTKVYKNAIFHIDKHTSSNFAMQNLAQIGGLLDNQEICFKLRKIVIDRQSATFTTDLPPSFMSTAKDILEKLNENQKQAVIKTLTADNYVLIKGYPGTGKTQTLVAMIELFVKLDKSVLITAHTNTALDNILVKLLERNIDFMRLGSSVKAHSSLFDKLEDNLTKHCDSPESLHTVYCSKKVIGVTCYGSSHPLLSRRKFDICIVDESTQVLQPTILRPLFSASKFVLVGDPEQLPPISRNNIARKLGLSESLFSRLDSEENTVILKLQYRMNKSIMNLANKLTYCDQLQVGNESVENATLPVSNISEFETCEKWVQRALSLRLKNSTILLNTSATYQLTLDSALKKIKGNCNYWEAGIVKRLTEVLINLGICAQTIGVISPYRAQVSLLRKILTDFIEVNTVDQYQGQDRSVIIYSCSKSISTDTNISEFDILEDHQRLTVAVTRAKHKLIIIGDINTLQRFAPFKKLLPVLKNNNHIYNLLDGQDDFSFDNLTQLLVK